MSKVYKMKGKPKPATTTVPVPVELYPFPNGVILAEEIVPTIAGPVPFRFEVSAWFEVYARDVHRRAGIDEARKLAVTIKGEPSENSAAVKWTYEVKVSLAKAEGGGVAYIDKDGRLCTPESVTADQIMLPLDQTGKKAA